jgi:integration host factor subunit alpha
LVGIPREDTRWIFSWNRRSDVTKSDIAGALHQGVGFTQKRSAEVVDLILDLMKEALERGEKLKISGFGNFEVRRKRPRRGRNPQTGEAIVLAGRRVVTFRPSPLLKERLNGRG